MVRVGRYGPYLERDGQRANVPEGTAPDELTPEFADELLSRPSGEKILGTDPQTGKTIVAKDGRYGPYVTEQLEEGAPASAKPRTASLLKSMDLDSVTLEDALRLLTLPRTLGELDGEPVTAQNGRYGPYVKKGTDSRSLESEEQMFTVTLDQAKELFAQPKTSAAARRGRRPRRCGSWARTPRPASRSCSRKAGSGRTSPTARRTPRCARATRSRTSRRSGPSSCWPTGGPRPRRRSGGPARPAAAARRARAGPGGPGQAEGEGQGRRGQLSGGQVRPATGDRAGFRCSPVRGGPVPILWRSEL